MNKLRFTEEQTIAILREQRPARRRRNSWGSTSQFSGFYKWKAKFGGFDVFPTRPCLRDRLKELGGSYAGIWVTA
jgi:hypothetical protein